MQHHKRYRVLVLGDLHFGESYTGEGALSLQEHGYSHSTERLKPFVNASDAVVLNLETPLLDPMDIKSPLRGKKASLHWADPVNTVEELQTMGVDAVSLANNHTLDYGVDGLESTFKALKGSGIEWFGAGRTLDEARAPFRLMLPSRIGGGEIHFHGGYQYATRSDVRYQFYADTESAGCAPLKVSEVPPARGEATPEDSFHIAFPHWGANYVWRSPKQYRMANRFLRKDYDLVLGHGGHSLQEIHRKQQRWVAYGLGNGVFNSAGKWRDDEEENGTLPFSFWAIVEVDQRDTGRTVSLKLYPVYSNNIQTGYQPGPVSRGDFDRIVEVLGSRPARPWRFANSAQTTGLDDLGHYVELHLGEWPQGERPSRLEPVIDGGDPGDWPLRSPSEELEDKVIGLNKHMGASVMALSAAADGAKVRWLGYKVALIECRGKRLLAHTYRSHESALAEAIVKDKVLTAELLQANSVETPKTVLVTTAEEAVEVASSIAGPVVLKPRDGNKSRGVSTGLLNGNEIRAAFAFARKHGSEVILQQHIEFAEELRVMASPEQAAAVNARVLPHVIGDGRSTVKQLVADKNLQRALNPSLRQRPIPVDDLTHRQLQSQGFTLDSILAVGQMVTVRGVAGLGAGGDTFQDLAGTSDHLKKTAADAVAAIPGMSWGGVDLIVEKDTGRPYVIEVNATAAYGAALFPTYGQPRDVGSDVWKLRYAATDPEVKRAPRTPEALQEPVSLPGATGFTDAQEMSLEQILEDSLTRQGFEVVARSPKILQVSTPQGTTDWVTKSGLTKTDRAAVQQVMQRHSWIYELLEIAQIPRPRARIVSSKNELARFVKGRVPQVLFAPESSSWAAVRSSLTTGEEAPSKPTRTGKMWVQNRLRGRRVQVMATRDRAWAVLAKANRTHLDNDHLAAASRLAVHAVRAVPELRWASVEILVRPTRVHSGQRGGLLVEGLSLAPRYSLREMIVAGNIDDFCREIVT